MAASHIAVIVAAGASALAVSTALFSWRFRKKSEAQTEALRQTLHRVESEHHQFESSINAFGGALIAIEGDEARLIWGENVLAECALALSLPADADAAAVLRGLAEASGDAKTALEALVATGAPMRVEAAAPQGVVAAEGRISGAIAWVRLVAGSESPSAAVSGPFTALAARIPAPCWILGRDGALLWANPAWLAAVETPSLAAARENGLVLDRGADALAAEASALHERREGFRWITLGGKRRAFRIIAEPVSDTETAAFALEVTEAEETRDQLRRHVRAHDDTLDRLDDAVAIFGPEGRMTFHNRAFEVLWKLDSAWLAERPTHAELLDRLRQTRRLPETVDYKAWKTKELEYYGLSKAAPDDQWSLPDGRTLRVVRQPHPLGGLLILFGDITDQLKLTAQYNGLIQVQKATLDQLSDAVAVFGSDGRLRLRNAAFDAFWKIDEPLPEIVDFDLIVQNCAGLLPDQNFWDEVKGRVADTDPTARVPASGEARLSDRRIAAWRSQPLPDGATLLAFADVTATRELEHAVAAREAALRESEKLKRDFVGNVSYELRTPLTTILGYSELLADRGSGLSEGDRGRIDSIRVAAAQLERSINDVLDMAQIDAGEMELSYAPANVADIVYQAESRAADLAAARGVTLSVEVDPDIGVVRGDERRLIKVLDHLIDNALISTPPTGQVRLKATRGAGELVFEVKDTGRGVPYHVQAHIFDRFIGKDRGGAGLGLALVKALVDLHGGWVALESEPGYGATFTVHLPDVGVPSPVEQIAAAC